MSDDAPTARPGASAPVRVAPGAPAALAPFAALVSRLHDEHRVSFVAAGDEKIYAYGGDGYVVVVSEALFGGLVELETPCGSVRIEPDSEGRAAVTAASGGDAGELLADATRNMELYYERRKRR